MRHTRSYQCTTGPAHNRKKAPKTETLHLCPPCGLYRIYPPRKLHMRPYDRFVVDGTIIVPFGSKAARVH